jgi:hypothetical protein
MATGGRYSPKAKSLLSIGSTCGSRVKEREDVFGPRVDFSRRAAASKAARLIGIAAARLSLALDGDGGVHCSRLAGRALARAWGSERLTAAAVAAPTSARSGSGWRQEALLPPSLSPLLLVHGSSGGAIRAAFGVLTATLSTSFPS